MEIRKRTGIVKAFSLKRENIKNWRLIGDDRLEWFGLFVFVVILMLLCRFGGTNITDESVEEYMKRLMSEDNKNK